MRGRWSLPEMIASFRRVRTCRRFLSSDGPDAFEFAKMGQELMEAIDHFPAPVYAAIQDTAWEAGSIWRWRAIIELPLRRPSLDIAARLLG